jgi:hypothetical protein
MTPPTVDLDSLARVVATAVGSIGLGVYDYFKLRPVCRTSYREDDPLMVTLTTGASEGCFALELVDAEKCDVAAVRVRGTTFDRTSSRRWAEKLWRAWVRGHATIAPEDRPPRRAR